MSAPSEFGRAYDKMRAASGETWRDYTRHAFVEGMKDGTLPRDCFLHYLRQDYVYLIHYSRAWALAVVKAATQEEMGAASATVDALVNHEMNLHVGICAAEGISKEELFDTPEAPENLAYTRYVLDAGFSGDYLNLLSALVPCAMGYAEIGSRLAAEATSDTYAEWINTYAGEEYQDSCRVIGRLFDAAFEARLGPDYDKLPVWQEYCKTFEKASRLEACFWQMGLSP